MDAIYARLLVAPRPKDLDIIGGEQPQFGRRAVRHEARRDREHMLSDSWALQKGIHDFRERKAGGQRALPLYPSGHSAPVDLGRFPTRLGCA
jgi:hypothetical protein